MTVPSEADRAALTARPILRPNRGVKVPSSRFPSSIMPSTAPKDSWKLTELMSPGCRKTIRMNERQRALSASVRLRRRPPAIMPRVRTEARTADALKSSSRQYPARNSPTRTKRPFCPSTLRRARDSAAASRDTCRPETASTWATPAREKEARVSSPSSCRQPSSRALGRALSSPKSRSRRSSRAVFVRAARARRSAGLSCPTSYSPWL